MKKVVISIACLFTLLCLPITFSQAAESNSISNTQEQTQIENTQEQEGTSHLVQMQEKSKKQLEDYKQEYGSDAYGLAAYLLNIVRIYSIPLCFIGIAVGAIYQYVIGIQKLDERDKGFGMIIGFVTILVIAQVLPLIFAIVVKGWRG